MANIAFILNKLPDGGVERVTTSLVTPLTDLGHKVYIFVHCLCADRISEGELPAQYVMLPYEAWDNRNAAAVCEGVVRHSIDIFFSPLIAPKYIFELKNRALCKVVFVLHSLPFYEKKETWWRINNRKVSSLGAWLSKYLIAIPKYYLGYYDRKIAKRYRYIYKNTDAFATLFDDYSRSVASAIGVGDIENSKLYTLQNPMPRIDYTCENVEREKRVLYVGRLSRRDKRIDRLLMVWERICHNFPDWELSIVGEGDDKENLMAIVAEHRLPRVQFYGFCSNPSDYYAKSEILCLTSDFEGCPMVLLEAQQCGCATMAFDCSAGVRELLSPVWENGVFVPNDDIEAYVEALSRLMDDDALRRKIQQNGLESVKRFSVDKSAQQYNALINRLL